jgi:hypothetical protein
MMKKLTLSSWVRLQVFETGLRRVPVRAVTTKPDGEAESEE